MGVTLSSTEQRAEMNKRFEERRASIKVQRDQMDKDRAEFDADFERASLRIEAAKLDIAVSSFIDRVVAVIPSFHRA